MKRPSKREINLDQDSEELQHRCWCLQEARHGTISSEVETLIKRAQAIYDWTMSDGGEA